MAAADLFTLEIKGRGGHGANPHETVDPVAVAAQVITNLQQIVSRETDPFDSVVVSVTTLDGRHRPQRDPGLGPDRRHGANALARAPRRGARRDGARHRRRHARPTAPTYRFDFEVGYDPVVNDRDASAAVREAIVAELGEEALVEVAPVMGGEDFSAYCAVAPAAFFWVGIGNEELGTTFPHHHPRFDIDEAALRDGIAVFARTALDALAVGARGREGDAGDRRRRARRDRVHGARVRARPEGASYGLEAAEKLGVDPARVFKTLVADVDGTLTVAIVPVGGAARPEGARQACDDGRRRGSRSARRATSPAGSARSGSASGCRRCSTSRRSRFETIHVSAGPARARDRARAGRSARADRRDARRSPRGELSRSPGRAARRVTAR